MKTKIYDIRDLNEENIKKSQLENPEDISAKQKLEKAKEKVAEAAQVIKSGGLVAFPTETVYGLGADALNPQAVAKIFAAKGRPSDNPLIVHISKASDVEKLTPTLNPKIIKLMDSFWPGPLTLVLAKKPEVPDITTGGLDTVAIRMPDEPVALELISQAGVPIAAPSANISGRPSPTKGEHVASDLDGKIDMILIGADCKVGIESTVLDMTGEAPVILRPGILTAEDIEAAIGVRVEHDPALLVNPISQCVKQGRQADCDSGDDKTGRSQADWDKTNEAPTDCASAIVDQTGGRQVDWDKTSDTLTDCASAIIDKVEHNLMDDGKPDVSLINDDLPGREQTVSDPACDDKAGDNLVDGHQAGRILTGCNREEEGRFVNGRQADSGQARNFQNGGNLAGIVQPGGSQTDDDQTGGSHLSSVQENGSFPRIIQTDAGFAPKSPGMKYTHYAPKAPMTILQGDSKKVKAELERLKKLYESKGLKVGIIFFEDEEATKAAHEFFARLRAFDDEGVDLILAKALSEADGVGFAVMNRMLKSAGYNVINV
ncbi:MAG: L-threonylcarbamoyladenylate synthase [Anaerovoracaceae bacterium]|jgi:tRNA threonylcarbamoyl adenosine modification protein (Sua5/YciO/YrdC/YwlC family)